MDGGNRVGEIEEIKGAIKAVECALRSVRPGQLLLVQADVIDETVDFIKQYLSQEGAGVEIDLIRALEVPTNGSAVFAAAQVMD